jgi:RHS repeat-associated protein
LNVSYNPATNRQTGDCADANGNLNSALNCYLQPMVYDVENRVVRNGGYLAWAYSYAPGNKRVWRGEYTYDSQTSTYTQTVDEVTFWGVNGQKLTTYALSMYFNQFVATATGSNYYFGGKLLKNAGGYVTPDRLGSIGKYFPYGQERPSATQDGKEKFATYFRDSETGLDYANNRYHQPGMGRFMTPDPSHTANRMDPNSWNQYAYSGGDPVNRHDPSGLGWNAGATFYDPGYDEMVMIQCAIYGEWCDAAATPEPYWTWEQFYDPNPSVFAYDLGQVGPGSGNSFLGFSGAYDLNYGAPGFGSTSDAEGAGCRQSLVDYVTETHASDLGLNFRGLGYTVGATTVAGYTVNGGVFDGQTEQYFTASPGAWDNLQAALGAAGFQQSPDSLHGAYSDSWREPTATYSLQISHDPLTGNIQVDIDPHNPNGSLLGHAWDVIRNGLTYSDTDYNDVLNHFSNLNFATTGCP